MDKVFNDAFSEFNTHRGFDDDFTRIFGETKITNNLNFDLQNEQDKFIVTLQLPNIQKNNVDVKLDNQRLTVSGDVKEQIEETNDNGKQYREHYSKFTRSLMLPAKVKQSSLKTKFEDNKLVITIMKEGSV
jgi:HSP20 family protein